MLEVWSRQAGADAGSVHGGALPQLHCSSRRFLLVPVAFCLQQDKYIISWIRRRCMTWQLQGISLLCVGPQEFALGHCSSVLWSAVQLVGWNLSKSCSLNQVLKEASKDITFTLTPPPPRCAGEVVCLRYKPFLPHHSRVDLCQQKYNSLLTYRLFTSL